MDGQTDRGIDRYIQTDMMRQITVQCSQAERDRQTDGYTNKQLGRQYANQSTYYNITQQLDW